MAPLYLTYRTYKVYLGRIEDEQRHVREMADLMQTLPRYVTPSAGSAGFAEIAAALLAAR